MIRELLTGSCRLGAASQDMLLSRTRQYMYLSR